MWLRERHDEKYFGNHIVMKVCDEEFWEPYGLERN
jgi:hypothetical protein